MTPFTKLRAWLDKEKQAGAKNPMHAVLATISRTNQPRSRIVAIREIEDSKIIFFTQKSSRKVDDLTHNNRVSMTFWLDHTQCEVVLEGFAKPLTDHENRNYWKTYPRESQVRFHSYAPTSGQIIKSKRILNEKMQLIRAKHETETIPFSEDYVGFGITVKSFMFYRYRTDELSDVERYMLENNEWTQVILSP